MLAFPVEVTELTRAQDAGRRPGLGFKTTSAQQSIDGLGCLEDFELSVRIGPLVIRRVAEENRTGSD